MPPEARKIKVIFSVTNSICHDQRVLKMADTVCKLGCEITIVGRISKDYCDASLVPFNTIRFRMLFNKGFLFYKFYNIRLFIYLLFKRSDILVANDLDTLLPNFLVSKIKRVPLVYDSHEYFTGVPELLNRSFVRSIWRWIEKLIFPKLKYVLTVSEPIALLYEKMYQVKPLVIRNVSQKAENIIPYTREEIGIRSNDLLIVIQGTGINIDKGTEELVEAVFKSEGIALLIIGSGDVVPELKKKVVALDISYKVKFIKSVPWETLMKFTKAADAGMCLEKDTNLNYRYSLPNKLFDYIIAGIPVIASNMHETGKIISEFGCGIIIDSVTPEKILIALSELRNNEKELANLKKNSISASEKLNWEIESEKVIKLYKDVLKVITV